MIPCHESRPSSFGFGISYCSITYAVRIIIVYCAFMLDDAALIADNRMPDSSPTNPAAADTALGDHGGRTFS